MKTIKIALIISVTISLALQTAMKVWTLPEISDAAAGLAPFDLRLTGYSHEDAMRFLLAISPTGRNIYLGPQHLLDLIYPASLALSVGLAIYLLGPLTRVWRAIFALAVLPGMVFDYRENIWVTRLLKTNPADITAAMVESASSATVYKALFDTAALMLLISFILLWIFRRISHRRPAGSY